MKTKTTFMRALLLIFALLKISLTYSQDSIPSIVFSELKTNYKDFVVVDDNIYAITKGDSLVVWNLKSNSIKQILPTFNNIAKRKNNKLVVTTNSGSILVNKDNKNWVEKDKFIGIAYSINVTDKNKIVIITNKGVYFKNKYYTPQVQNRIYAPKFKSPDTITKYLREPRFTYIDKKNRLWLNYVNGVFSMYPWFFDTVKKKFIEEEYLSIDVDYNEFKNWNRYQTELIEAFPDKIKIVETDTLYRFPSQIPIYDHISGMTEDNEGNIYIAQFGGHMTTDSGISIYSQTKFKDFYKDEYLKEILDYHIWTNSRNGKSWEVKNLIEFLGSITFNKYNNQIYFFTNRGFFQLECQNGTYSKSLYILPTGLNLSNGEFELGGYTLAIKKMEFIDENRFVFLSTIDGIGYFDGHQIKYYK